MSEFSDSDYIAMLCNINAHKHTEGDYLKIFTDLRLYEEFSALLVEPMDRNQIIAWIALVYDQESPFRKKYSELDERKFRSAREVGFELNSQGKFDDYLLDIFNGQNQPINDMIVAYCKLHASTRYSYYVMLEALFFSNLKLAVSGLDANKMKMAELKSIQSEMAIAQRELLAGDANKNIEKTLYRRINREKIDYSPEAVSGKIKKNGIENVFSEDKNYDN